MTQEEQIWNEAFEKSHIGKETQPPIVKYRQVVEENERLKKHREDDLLLIESLQRQLDIATAERDELNNLHEELIIEKTELSKSYTQIGENLAYHIKQEDVWRQRCEVLEANPPYSIEYVNSLKNQVKGLEEKVADLEREIKEYYP